VTNGHPHAALDCATRKRAAVDLPPLSAQDENDVSFTTIDNEPLYNVVAQYEATALLNLHT
jgi:hypothetical protein